MIPITRIEHYLAKMNGEDVQIPAPITRKELYLAKICGEDVEVPEPITIDEKFLFALAGGEVNLPKPVTRLQHIMAKRLGLQAAEIEPITRQEYFWLQVWKTASGAIASFVTSIAYPVRSLVAQIEPVQDLHGYAQPWAGGAGKNLLPKGENRTSNGITFTVADDGSVSATGTSTATTFWGVQFTIPAGTYTFSGCQTNSLSITCDIRDAIGGSGISGISAESGAGSTFTRTDALTAWFNIRIPSGVTVNNLVFYPQIETGSAKTSFAPYSNICPISGWDGLNVWVENEYDPSSEPTVEVSWETEAGTVYGGEYEVIRGNGTSTMAKETISIASIYAPSSNPVCDFGVFSISNSFKAPLVYKGSATVKGNKGWSNTDAIGEVIVYSSESNQLAVSVPKGSTLEEAKALFDGTDALYELATPQSFTHAPQEVDTLEGQNNVWVDTGDVEVEYRES